LPGSSPYYHFLPTRTIHTTHYGSPNITRPMVSRYVHQPQISYLGSITRLSDSRKPGYHTLTTHFGPDRYVHDAWPCEQGVKGIAVHVILRPPTSQCKPTQAPVSKQSMLGDYPNRSGSRLVWPKPLCASADV